MRRALALLLSLAAPLPALAQETCDYQYGRYISPGEQTFELRETVVLDDGTEILGVDFGPFVGELAKVYIFIRFDGDCPLEAVSLGSYEWHVDGDDRAYHLDYYGSESRALIRFYETPPDYGTIREEAFGILGGS